MSVGHITPIQPTGISLSHIFSVLLSRSHPVLPLSIPSPFRYRKDPGKLLLIFPAIAWYLIPYFLRTDMQR